MPEGTEVRVRLVADDQATITVEQLREALRGGNEELERGHEHAEHLGAELFKAELYVEAFKGGAELVGEAMRQAWELTERMGDAAMEAANEMNVQVRASTGLMSLMDAGAHQMGAVRDYAADVREELAKAGTAAGVSTSAMSEMFDHLIERGATTTEKAKELTGEMALVGKVVPRGAEGLAEGFNMMELGIIRARNPLVQLIASTHVLAGNAHAVAAAMQRMAPEKQMELATRAIERQAEVMRRGGAGGAFMVPTMEELKASFGNLREQALEGIGQPMLDRLVPALTSLRDYLSEHSEQIADYADKLGTAAGDVIAKVEGVISDVYHGAERDWPAIKREFEAAAQDWKDAWSEIVGDGHTLRQDMTDMARNVAEAFHTASGYFTATIETLKNVKDLLSAEDFGEGLAHWGEGVAKARMAAAGKEVEERARPEAVAPGADEAQAKTAMQEKFDAAITKYRNWAAEAGQSAEAIDKYVEQQRAYHDAELADLSRFREKVESSNVDEISKQLQQAQGIQDRAWLGAALNYVAESDAMTKALQDGSIHVQGGFDALRDVIERESPELAKKLKKMSAEGIKAEGGIKGAGVQQNFFGGVHIKQDFRDQDPDRIMEVFRADLAQQAINRRQSRLVSPFGL
jgi:hypothetical protein